MIAQIGADLIFDRCFDVGLNPTGDVDNLYCQKIRRNPETGDSLSMEVTYNNESRAKLSGVDINADWSAEFADEESPTQHIVDATAGIIRQNRPVGVVGVTIR